MMTLDYILLSLLRTPLSGYDLRSEFEAGAAAFWPAQLSQIYPTLRRMEIRGWLRMDRVDSKRGPQRKVYERTTRGTEALHEWLKGPPQFGSARFPYLGQLAALSELEDPLVAAEFLEQLRARLGAAVETLVSLEPLVLGDGATPESCSDEAFFDWAALRVGLVSLQAKVGCCSELLRTHEARGVRRRRVPDRPQGTAGAL